MLKATGSVTKFDRKDGEGRVVVKIAGISQADRLNVNFTDSLVIRIDKEAAKQFAIGQSFEITIGGKEYPGAWQVTT